MRSFQAGTPALRNCPYLGLEIDPQTCFQYPSSGNFCHQTIPLQSINVDYQQNICLTAEYTHCKVYTSAGWRGQLPLEIGSAAYNKRTISIGRLIAIVSIFVILVVVGAFLYATRSFVPQQAEIPFLIAIPSSTNMPGINPTVAPKLEKIQSTATLRDVLLLPDIPEYTPQATSTRVNSSTPTQAPTLSVTPSFPTAGPGMGTPFGAGNRFAFHTVKFGESLSLVAETYQTTVGVIQASNVLIEGASIWPGTVLVILPGEKNQDNVQKYLAILVEEPTLVTSLSLEHSILPEEFRELNSLGEDDMIPAGRWIIVPVMGD